MGRDGEATRLALIRTAERLFAERGIAGVSLREIAEEAQQKNHSSASYHFGTKQALVDAIIERHSVRIYEHYQAALDALDARGSPTLEGLIELMLQPLISKLDDPDGGREYLAICAQLSVSPSSGLDRRPATKHPAILRLAAAASPFLTMPENQRPLRFARLTATLYASILQFDRFSRAGLVDLDRQGFTRDLVATLLAQINARA